MVVNTTNLIINFSAIKETLCIDKFPRSVPDGILFLSLLNIVCSIAFLIYYDKKKRLSNLELLIYLLYILMQVSMMIYFFMYDTYLQAFFAYYS